MFGHRDKREDTGLFPRLLSIATFPLYAYPVFKWGSNFYYKTKKTFGMRSRYLAFRNVMNETWDDARRIFVNDPSSGGITDLASRSQMDYYWNIISNENFRGISSEDIMPSIIRFKKELLKSEKELNDIFSTLEDKIKDEYDYINRRHQLIPKDQDRKLAYDHMSGQLKNFDELLIEYKNKDVLSSIISHIKTKYPDISEESIRDNKLLSTLPPNALIEIKDIFSERIFDMNDAIRNIDKNWRRVRDLRFENVNYAFNFLKKQLDFAYRDQKIELTAVKPSPIISTPVDIKGLLKEFPDTLDPADIKNELFFKKFFETQPKLNRNLTAALKQSGIPIWQSNFLNKSAEEVVSLKTYKNIAPGVFGHTLHKISKKLEQYLYDPNTGEGSIYNVETAFTETPNSGCKLTFNIYTRGKQPEVKGNFTYSILIPKESRFRWDITTPEQIPYPRYDMLESQTSTFISNLDNIITKSINPDYKGDLQSYINTMQRKSVPGISAENAMIDFSRSAIFASNYMSYIKMRPGYNKNKIHKAFDSVLKFKKENLIHHVDVGFGTLEGIDGKMQKVIRNISVTTQEVLDSGEVQIRGSWMASIYKGRATIEEKKFNEIIGQYKNFSTIEKKYMDIAQKIIKSPKESMSEKELVQILSEYFGMGGKVVSKAISLEGGDYDTLMGLLDKYKEDKELNLTGLRLALDKRNIIDTQKFYKFNFRDIPGKPAITGEGIENVGDAVQNILDDFRDGSDTQLANEALKYVQNTEKLFFGRALNGMERRSVSFRAAHKTKFDNVYDLIHATLISQHVFKGINSQRDFANMLNRLGSKYEQLRQQSVGLLPSQGIAAGKFSVLDRSSIFPLSNLGYPAVSKYHQLLISIKTGWKGGKPGWRNVLPLTTKEVYEGMKKGPLKDYYSTVMTFLDPTIGEGLAWSSKNLTQDMRVYEHKMSYAVDMFHPSIENAPIGAEIKAKLGGAPAVIGYADGETRFYEGRFDFKIINKSSTIDPETGKRLLEVEEIIPPTLGLKVALAAGGRGLEVTSLPNFFKTVYDLTYASDIFKRNDHVALLKVLLGRLCLFARGNQNRLKTVSNLVDKIVDNGGRHIVKSKIIDNSLSIFSSAIEKETVGINEVRFIVRQILDVYKKTGLVQGVPIADSEMYEKAHIWMKNKGWSVEAKKAMDSALVYSQAESSWLFNAFAKEWLGEERAQEFLSSLGNFKENQKVMSDTWDSMNVAGIFDVMKGGPSGLKYLHGGILTDDTAASSSTIPSWSSTPGLVKISGWDIMALENMTGAESYVNNLKDSINAQAVRTLGTRAFMHRVGRGGYPPKGVNVAELIEKVKRGEAGEQVQGWYKTWFADRGNYAKFRNSILVNYKDKTWTQDAFQNIVNSTAIEDLVQEFDGSHRVRMTESVRYLEWVRDEIRKAGGGYIPLAKGTMIKTGGRFGGSKEFAYLQIPEIEITSLEGTGRRMSVFSEVTATIDNALLHIRNPRTMEESTQRVWDLLGQKSVVDNWYARVPGVSALIQFGKPFVYDAEGKAITDYTKETTLIHEVLVDRKWARGKGISLYKNIMKSLDAEDAKFIAEYLTEHSNTVPGVPQGFKKHPAITAKMNAKKILAFEKNNDIKISELLNIMKSDDKRMETHRFLKLVRKAVDQELFPAPVMVAKKPMSGITTYMPSMAYFRDLNLKSGAAETVVQISQAASLWAKIDMDGDRAALMLAPKPFGKIFKAIAALPTEGKGLQFLGMHYSKYGKLPGGILSTEEPMTLFLDRKINGFSLLPWSEAYPLIRKDIDENIKTLFSPEFAVEALKRVENVKKGVPEATKVTYTISQLMKTVGREWSIKTHTDLFNTFANTIEWSIQQKKNFHNVDLFFNYLENMSSPNLAKKLEQGIMNSSKLFLGGNNIKSRGLGNLEFLLKDAPKETWELIKNADVDLVNQQSYLALLYSAEKRFPNLVMYGNKEYQATLAAQSILEKIHNMNLSGKFIGEIPREWQLPEEIPLISKENSFGKGFKRAITNTFNEQTWKNFELGGKLVLGGVAAYTLFNFFRPDQSKYLGHMPGKGGEYYDWSFTRPEINWSNYMNTPFENIYNRDKTYLKSYNPYALEQAINRRRKKKFIYQSNKSELSPVIYDRSTFEF